jgi:hypothetical protein
MNNEQIRNALDLAYDITTKGNSNLITIYAIEDKQKQTFITYKQKRFYTTRSEARRVRRSIDNNQLRVVKAEFVNLDKWQTSK